MRPPVLLSSATDAEKITYLEIRSCLLASSGGVGKVFLVGAGPGDPGLLTVRARRLLDLADVVVHDALVSDAILESCRRAQLVDVGKRASIHTASQESIHALLIEHARAGRTVVRLKGGDPFVFGRGGEECAALHSAGVPFEVVPGITSGIAALAYAGIPVTHRDLNSAVTLLAGHEKEQAFQDDESAARSASDDAPLASDLDWAALARLPCLVFYMGAKSLKRNAERLLSHGMDSQTPAAAVQWGTTARQRTVVGTLADISQRVLDAGLTAPMIVVVGRVVGLREQCNWFETRPLFGKTVLVTRTRQQSSELSELLVEMGAEPLEAPTIRVVEPTDRAAIVKALRTGGFDWVLFTSTNAPPSLKRFLHDFGFSTRIDLRAIAAAKIGVVGARTAESLRYELCLEPDIVAEESSANGLAETLQQRGEVSGKRFLLLRADIARPRLVQSLKSAGAADVSDVAIYRTEPTTSLPEPIRAALDERRVDWLTFASSSAATNLVKLLGANAAARLQGVKVASIGPQTSRTIRELGLTVTVQARDASIESLVQAMVDHERGS
jgi:uroporphyrinogen III methyltransferase/synthase